MAEKGPSYEFKFVVRGVELSSETQERFARAVAETGLHLLATLDTEGDRAAVSRIMLNPQPLPPREGGQPWWPIHTLGIIWRPQLEGEVLEGLE